MTDPTPTPTLSSAVDATVATAESAVKTDVAVVESKASTLLKTYGLPAGAAIVGFVAGYIAHGL